MVAENTYCTYIVHKYSEEYSREMWMATTNMWRDSDSTQVGSNNQPQRVNANNGDKIPFMLCVLTLFLSSQRALILVSSASGAFTLRRGQASIGLARAMGSGLDRTSYQVICVLLLKSDFMTAIRVTVNKNQQQYPTFEVTVKDKQPIFIYSSAGNDCQDDSSSAAAAV